MELKVGMYVRTNEGKITKLVEIDEDGFKKFDKFVDFTNYEIIGEPSYDIIDLIELGDYVNGEKITRVIPQDICGYEVLDYQHIFVNDREIFKEDIKSIVTKEQFEAMKYEIK